MKKKLLIFTLIMPFVAFSQAPNPNKFGNPVSGGPEKISLNQTAKDPQKPDSLAQKSAAAKTGGSAKRAIVPYNFVKVGSTYYDLQTNASMGRRIHVYPDGRVSVVWTTSNDEAYNNRGTGYNHFDLSNWLTAATPTTPRIESTRLGWPSIGVNGTKEWVMAHDAANGGFIMSTNASIGSTSWTSGNLVLTQSLRRPIWGRVMNSGNTFHCIASYADSGAVGEPRAPRINGVFAPMTYSRSLDGGVNWDIQHSLLPGYDDSRMINGGGDQYSIDVRDSIVAIITGDLLEDVVVWKSTNNGLTFTKMIIDSFKYAPYKSNKLMLDTPFVCDGSVDVLIDPQGRVHAFWAVSRVIDEDTTDQSYSFFPGTSLLATWSEVTGKKDFIAAGSMFDRNGDTVYSFSRGNTAILTNGVVAQDLKNVGVSSVARLGNTSVLHMPSAGMDASGRIFVTFSLPLELDVDANNVNLRDIMIVHSTDTGKTWEMGQDLTQIEGFEEEFASIGRHVDNFVHVVFQRDATAGTNLQNNSTIDNNHPAGINDIMYAAVPVSKILDGSINTTGIERFDANQEIFVVSQNYPNPFSNSSEVIIWLNTNSEVSIEITDVSGKVISTQSFGELGAGNQSLTMNGETLSSGIYFYTVKTATHAVTRKMIVNN